MKWRIIFLAALAAAASGCRKSAHDTDDKPLVLGFKTCSAAQAKYAAAQTLAPILSAIADPKTRDEGCAEFDTVLRFEDFDKFKSEDCEWAGEASRQFVDLARPHQQKLAQLCNWAEKDAEREGAAILNSMSPENRQVMEDAYNGY